MSSNAVLNSVSKKLRYYFDVKRLEDGFDLSTSDCPKLDHPPLKPRATLQYDGLHDRPLKHYFSPKDVKVALTQMKTPPDKKGREKTVKKKISKQMMKYDYAPSVLHDAFYLPTKRKGKKLRPELQGFGVPLRKHKMPHHGNRGGYPVLRTVPPSTISAVEANRLVSMASKILVATEVLDLGTSKPRRSRTTRPRTAAPKSFESSHSQSLPKLTPSRKEQTRKQSKTQPKQYSSDGETSDSAYHSPTPRGMYVTIDGVQTNDDTLPPWLKTELNNRGVNQKENDKWVRPVSNSSGSSQPFPPSNPKVDSRPTSGHSSRRSNSNSVSSSRANSIDSTTVKTPILNSKEDLSVQTGGELLKNYNAIDRVIGDGDHTKYKIHVHTGDIIGASTKAPIRIVLIGDRGRTKEIPLKNSSTHKVKFQRGQEDIFEVQNYHVGPLRRIGIGHDKTEFGFGWFLDKVLVKDVSFQKQYVIKAGKWLSARDKDALTFRELEVQSTMEYEEEVSTDNESQRSLPKKPISYEKANQESVIKDTGNQSDTSMRENFSGDEHSGCSMHAPKKGKKSSKKFSSSSTSDSESISSDASSATETNSTASKSHFKDLTRHDDFFDKSGPTTDYASVIESLSTCTSNDNADDFPQSKEIAKRGPLSRRPTLLPILTDTDSEIEIEGESSADEDVKEKIKPRRQSIKITLTKAEEEELNTGLTIHEACRNGDLERVKVLLSHKSSLKDQNDSRGWKPLHIAAGEGHTHIVNWLMTYGVGLNISTPDGDNAIHLATINSHMGVMAVLLAMGADLNATNADHQTPLYIAAFEGHTECAKWLAYNDVDLTIPDNMGKLPEDIALERGHQDVYDILKNAHLLHDFSDSQDSSEEESGSDDETTTTEQTKHIEEDEASSSTGRPATPDEDLLEKRKLYVDQQERMKEKNLSFLDAMRAELD